MEFIKTLEEAEKTVEGGEHLYLVAIVTRDGSYSLPGSFVMRSKFDHPLWKMYYLLQGDYHKELDVLRDGNGLICVTSIIKLT